MTQLTLAKIIADFETSLAAKMAVGATSATLISATDDDLVALPAGRYFFTIDGDNSSKEHISCDLSSTALTNVKTVSRQGTETSGVLRAHRVGAKVVITDWAHLKKINDLLDGTTNFNSTVLLGYDSTTTITGSNNFATKSYVDGVAIAGGSKATEAVYGITRLSLAAVSAVAPIAVGDNDTRIPSQGENDALAGTSGTPSSTNKFVTNDDVAEAKTASKIARRDANSDILVATTPTAGDAAASKTYIQAQDTAVKAEVVYSLFTAAGSANARITYNTAISVSETSYTKKLEFNYLDSAGTVTFYYTLDASGGNNDTIYGRVYINGIAVGSEHSISRDTGPTANHTDTVTVAYGDLVQLYSKVSAGTKQLTTSSLRYDKSINYATNVRNLP